METLLTSKSQNHQLSSNKSSGDTLAVSSGVMAGKSSSSSNPKLSPPSGTNEPSVSAYATETMNGSQSVETASVVYDVEHLATFSTTGGSHELTTGDNDSYNQSQTTTTKSNNISGGKTNNAPTNVATTSTFSESNKATVATSDGINKATTPKVALQRLFELEKLSGIWTQHMQIELRDDFMLIVDCETNSIVERFNRDCVTKPEAFSHYNDIYNNIVVFIIQQPTSCNKSQSDDEEVVDSTSVDEPEDTDAANQEKREESNVAAGEIHIFQCVSHKAQQLVTEILDWKAKRPLSSSENSLDTRSSADSQPATDMIKKSAINNNKMQDSTRSPSLSSSIAHQQQSKSPLIKSASSPPPATSSNGSTVATATPNGKPMVTVASSASVNEQVPIVNVNVKETVQVFNQIAALREKSKPTSPTNNATARPLSDASAVSASSNCPQQQQPPVSASSQPSSTPAASADQQATKVAATANQNQPRSPNGDHGQQLYKQRSIRATLAPKFASGGSSLAGSSAAGAGGASVNEQQPQAIAKGSNLDQLVVAGSNNSTNSASSTASSSFNQGGPLHDSGSSSGGSGSGQQARNRHLDSPDNVGHQHHNQSTNANKLSSGRTNHHHHVAQSSGGGGHKSYASRQHRTSSDSARSHGSSGSAGHNNQHEQVTTNESYVSVLNHCFDDIEKFIIRLQQAVAAIHELQAKRKLSKRSAGNHQQVNGGAMPAKGASQPVTAAELTALSTRARGPSEDDYFEILSKFKLAFNLLAKLKGCIHEPNAPELVHFLFTPLAIIIESARNSTPPIDPTLVGIPYLNQDALDLLSNCCTSKESDMWISLGPNWTQTIDMNLLKASRLPSSFQPIFSDGWAPIIGELELIGLVVNNNSSSQLSACAVNSLADVDESDGGTGVDISREHIINGTSSYSTKDNSRTQGYFTAAAASDEHPADKSSAAAWQAANKQHVSRNLNKKRGGPATNGSRRSDSVEPQPGYHHRNHYQHAQPHHLSHHNPPVYYHYLLNSSNPSLAEASGFSRMSAVSAEQLAATRSSGRHPVGRHHQHHHKRPVGVHAPPNEYPHDQPHNPADYPPMSLLASDELDDPNLHQMITHHHSDDYSELHDDTALELPARHKQPSVDYGGGRVPLESGAGRAGAKSARSHASSKSRHYSHHSIPQQDPQAFADDPYLGHMSAADYEAMLMDLGPMQTDWFHELQARGALVVRVLFSREANNDRELSVRRGEILEILDDTRKWWRARNIELQVAHVPHTIVAVMQGYRTLDELLANNPTGDEQPVSLMTSGSSQRHLQHRSFAASQAPLPRSHQVARHSGSGANLQYYGGNARNSASSSSGAAKTAAGAFRYF